MKIRWKKVFYFVFLLGSLFGFKNAVGQNNNEKVNLTINKSTNIFQIKGQVIDSLTNIPRPFCLAILIDSNQNYINWAICDFDGCFTIDDISAGKYTLQISDLGYETIEIQNITINNNTLISAYLKKEIIITKSELISEPNFTCYMHRDIDDRYQWNKADTIEDSNLDKRFNTLKSFEIRNMPIRR